MKTTIYLIRHGTTDWNEQGKYQGTSDIPLNKRGLEEVKKVAKELAHIPFKAIYSSPLIRASKTAEEIARHHGFSVTHLPELRERSFGIFEGLTFEEIESHPQFTFSKPGEWYLEGAPEGETFDQTAERTGNVLLQISKNHAHETVGVVAHGGVIKAMGYYIGHLDKNGLPKVIIANARPLIIEYLHAENRFVAVDFPFSTKK